ncbi:MAG: hypothetical protein Q9M39_04450 [Sulfurovum sp.]|nr:hypothetical protein [Sulfurovum sp.]
MSESNTPSIEEEHLLKEQNLPIVQLPESILNNTVTMQAIRKVEQHFKQNTSAYMERIQGYNMEMAKIQNSLSRIEKSKEKEETRLLEIQAKLNYETQLFQRLNGNFLQQVASVSELKNEYKEMVNAIEYTKLLKHKEQGLRTLLDEIEELEMILLKEELERLNLLEKLEPQRQSIVELQVALRELELEKEHFESTKIHQIAQLGFMDDNEIVINQDEIVDIIVLQDDDSK